ncbi:MAG: SGNH/GDSL hydrolase family protein, partial [Actinophytocola sp.]
MRTTSLSLLLTLLITTLVTGTANAAAAARYVALGDSAASGPVILPVDLSSPGCYRSMRNYPK